MFPPYSRLYPEWIGSLCDTPKSVIRNILSLNAIFYLQERRSSFLEADLIHLFFSSHLSFSWITTLARYYIMYVRSNMKIHPSLLRRSDGLFLATVFRSSHTVA
jgi:hypothetical protein